MGSIAPKLVSIVPKELPVSPGSEKLFEPNSGVWDKGSIHDLDPAVRAMSSEVKTLLGALGSNVEFLRAVLGDGPIDPLVAESMSDIDVCCERINSLLDDALAKPRLEARSMARSAVTLNGIVRAAVKQVRVRCEAKQIEIEVRPEAEFVALLDRTLMTRLVENLLEDTLIEATAGSHVSIRYGLRSDQVEVSIQCESAPRRRDHGSLSLLDAELGPDRERHLAFCRMIAQRHGGRIEVWPEGGEGPIFVVTLPWIRPTDTR